MKSLLGKISSIAITLRNIAHRFGVWSSADKAKYNNLIDLVPEVGDETDPDRQEAIIPLFDDESMMTMAFNFIRAHQVDKKYKIRFLYVLTSIDQPYKYWRKTLDRYLFKFHLRKIAKVYRIPVGAIAYSNFFHDYERAPQTIPTKEALLALQYKDIVIGDLVYDTYMRYRSKPAAALDDPELYRIIGYAQVLTDYWNKILIQRHPSFLLFPYCAYIHWGIPARMAMKNGITVLVYGSPYYYLARPNTHFPYHTKNFNLYPKLWQNLSNKTEKMMLAKNRIEERLMGKTIGDLGYMKQSSYEGPSTTFKPTEGRPFAVVFLHCFFDSPHIYGDLVFPDFLDWVTHILDFASIRPQFDFLVKPHPNGMPGNDPIILSLREKYARYPNIQFLDKNLSNQSLASLKPNAIFTVYGTIAHEFAYLGVPVICAGENPHKMYNFVYQTTTVEAFNTYLENLGDIVLPENYSKEQILEFYYMHYLYFAPGIDAISHPMEKNFQNGNWVMYPEFQLEDLIYA